MQVSMVRDEITVMDLRLERANEVCIRYLHLLLLSESLLMIFVNFTGGAAKY